MLLREVSSISRTLLQKSASLAGIKRSVMYSAVNRQNDPKLELIAKQTCNDNPFDTYVIKPDAGQGMFKSMPILIPSTKETRIVGCCCEDDYQDVVWFELKKGECQQCECGNYFKLVPHDPLDPNVKPKRLLVDTGEANVPEYIENLKNTLELENCELSDIVLTHWHPDHVGGVPDVLRMLKSKPRIHKFPRTDGPEPNIGEVQRIEDGSVLEVEGAGQVKLMHTPGHTQDHVVVYLSDGTLLSADCILGEGTAVFEDLHAYMISLQKILDLSPSQIYPGHGPIIQDPIPKIEFYIKHRTERENQILAALSSQPQPQTPGQLVKIIYKDTPEHLHLAAENNVNHHLSKLLKENKVENKDGFWRTY